MNGITLKFGLTWVVQATKHFPR